MQFNEVDEDTWSRFNRVYVGFVENPSITYNMQEIMNSYGYITVKVTPMGAIYVYQKKWKRGNSGVGGSG